MDEINIADLDEQIQEKIRKVILETTFIKEEEIDGVDLFQVISDEAVDDDNNNNSVAIEEGSLSKPTELKPIDNSD